MQIRQRKIHPSSALLPGPYNVSAHVSCQVSTRTRREAHSLSAMTPVGLTDALILHPFEYQTTRERYRPCACFLDHVRHLCQFFKLQRERLQLGPLCSSSFSKQFSAHHPAHRQYIRRRWKCVHQQRFQTAAKVGCAPNSCNLEYRYPSLLNECVHLHSVGFVCTIIALHNHDFFIGNSLCTSYKKLCNPCEASFSRSSSRSLCRPRVLVSRRL